MEPVLLYGVPQGCSFGSIVALEWLGAPYRLCRIEMPGDMQGDLYGKVNPVRETPVLILEDGTPLSESAAILQNIARRGEHGDLGDQPGSLGQDRVNQALAFLNTTFFSAFGPLWRAYEIDEGPEVKAMLGKLGRELVAKAHRQLDLMLAGREWLAGERRSVADAYFAGLARWGAYHKVIDATDYPNLQRLLAKLDDDPAVVFARAIENEQPAKSAGGFRGHVGLEELASQLAA